MKILVDADVCPVVHTVERIAKKYDIPESGRWYTDANIDQMLMERHLNKKARGSKSKNHLKGPAKRTQEDDLRFAESFERIIKECILSCSKTE
ncbi:MAG: DUF188 domain-containing protein [Clostridiales bacterium]|nr:DUF188 domain-containing protein [Clostridiales bacterium]